MDVDAAQRSQIRNIEATYGKPLDHWFAVIDASGLTKHNQVVAMLKADHGLAHGAAHRLSLLARQRHDGAVAAPADPAELCMLARKPGCGRCTMRSWARSARLAASTSPRRRATLACAAESSSNGPARSATRIDLGLILPATMPAAGRLEPAAKFNPLFTHRVRITAATDLDDELRGWLAAAYTLAG